jgi:hypothetical protein
MIQAVHDHLLAVAGAVGQAQLAALTDHSERVRQLVVSVPPAVWHKVSAKVATHYHNLEGRYGRATAIAIVSAGIVGTAVPLPGTTVLAAAPLIALAELHHQLVGKHDPGGASWGSKLHLTESEILDLGRQWMKDLADALKDE